MDAVTETPLNFSLDDTECSDEVNSDTDVNSESICPDAFAPGKLPENMDFDEAEPSGSGLNLKPNSKSRSKGPEVCKPYFPWKYILPKRGISKLIFQVVASTEKQSGVSLQALKKSVVATGYDLEKKKNYFKRVLRALVARGLLRKLTGHGLTGSYAISEMMLKVLRKRKKKKMRKRRRRRRKKKSNAMASLVKKKAPKRRQLRSSKGKKNKLSKSDLPDLCRPMVTTGGSHI
nr:PREDICTED: spermatid-specific linker histone H1-like protein [Anolis carolinensis]|eukprot:XP_008111735.1 PREDICTED: spermatid-specific linker histone H1-like protein [Anolis carolinensis]